MTRAVVFLFATVMVFAAPVPKTPAKKIEDVFGTLAEASGVKCEMPREGELRVAVSKDSPVDAAQSNRVRPLASKVMEGDFTLTFRVAHIPSKDASTAAGKSEPTVAAGVAIVPVVDDPTRSFVLLQRHVKDRDAWKSEQWSSAVYPKGGGGSTRYQGKLEDSPLHFRLTREGNTFTSWVSNDGKEWTTLGVNTIPGLGTVNVGPVVTHNTNSDHEAVFDQYELKPLKK